MEEADLTALKRQRTTALMLCTKKRNAISALVESDDPPLNEIKTAFDDFQRLLSAYRRAHEDVCGAIANDDDFEKEQASYEAREQEKVAFRQKMKTWIERAESALMDDLDSASTTSQRSRSTHSSASASSSRSALAQEKARLAELLVEKETQSLTFNMERELALQKLEVKIRKAEARQAVFAAEVDGDISSAQEVGEASTPHGAIDSVFKVKATNARKQLPLIPERELIDPNACNSLPKSCANHASRPNSVSATANDPWPCESNGRHVNSNLNPSAASFHPGNSIPSDPCLLHDFDPFFVEKNPQPERSNVHALGEPLIPIHNQYLSPPQPRNDPPMHYDRNMHRNANGDRTFVRYESPKTDFLGDRDARACVADLARVFALPQPDIPQFSGDPTEYDAFISAFENRVASKTTSPSDRLYFLHQYVRNEAKDLVSGCLHMEASLGYQEARRILEEEYGSAYAVSTAYFNKLMDWPAIRQEDGPTLKKFSLLMLRCKHAMHGNRSLSILDHIPNLQAIVRKLPSFMQNRWRDRVGKLKMQYRLPDFTELTAFIQYESNILNDPVFGKKVLSSNETAAQGRSPHDRRSASFAVNLGGCNESNEEDRTSGRCTFCSEQHDIDKCQDFLQKPLSERKTFLREKRLCFTCFGHNHLSRGCTEKRTCNKCHKKHPTSLHDENFVPAAKSRGETVMTALNPSGAIMHSVILVRVKQHGSNNDMLTYAFYDSGSSGCFISDELKQQLNAHGQSTYLKLTTMNGDLTTETIAVDGLIISDINGDNSINLPRCYTMDDIPVLQSQIPKASTLAHWKHIEEATNSMPKYMPDVPVGLLIGNNCPKAMQPLKVIPGNENEPFAILYPHGWTINGPLGFTQEGAQTTVICHRVITQRLKPNEVMTTKKLLHLLDTDFMNQTCQEPDLVGLSIEDKAFMEIANTKCSFNDGHFELPLPFKTEKPCMPFNRNQAERRAISLKKKMIMNPTYHQEYTAFVNNLLTQGYARELRKDEIPAKQGQVWYLPHHGVLHPTKKKLRVVYDCSAQFNGTSLNDILLQGPHLTGSLLGVLLRFRMGRIAFMCDIESMFHQVHVTKEHQNFLRFLWWPNGNMTEDLREFVMCVHLFGATSSPSIASYALQKTADLSEQHISKEAAEVIRKNFYVDDCLKSVDSLEEARTLAHQIKEGCRLGGFRIHKFSSNSKDLIDSIPMEDRAKDLQGRSLHIEDLPSERALGVIWDAARDVFTFELKPMTKPTTRRGLLSMISSVYDPFGLVAPFMLSGKKILQDLCREDASWDEILSEDYTRRWDEWKQHLNFISQIQITRCLRPAQVLARVTSKQLHVFCDASNIGYGAVAYLRLQDENGKIYCTFILGKARLAPLKKTTVPRLELTAATMAVRIGRLVLCELNGEVDSITYHTDSTSVLHFLANKTKRFPVFIANRVQFIQDHSRIEDWRYVPTSNNPADIASRGTSVEEIISNSLWLQGPTFLCSPENTWPEQPEISPQDDSIQVAATTIESRSESAQTLQTLIEHYSSWRRLKFAVSVYRKVATILKAGKERERAYAITTDDLRQAEKDILRFTQLQHFGEEMRCLQQNAEDTQGRVKPSSPIRRLDPFLEDELLKVGGRLKNATFEEAKHPILLPKSSHVTRLIIRDTHEHLAHTGRNHVLSSLREKYWIIHGNSSVRSVISKCITCRKLRHLPSEQKMADLPTDRCSTTAPFTSTGVDFFGPFHVKQGRKTVKRYGVLFTCMSSRSVHLEVAASLDTSSFINALRRFIARRGPIAQLRCDNGTNFTGAEKELREAVKEMDKDGMSERLSRESIKWTFNTPSASHHGGIWERLIRSVRSVLAGLMKDFGSMFDDEGIQTLMCEVEAILNTRPITTISSDPNDMEPLTPNHILTGKTRIVTPPPGCFQRHDLYMRRRWRRVQYTANLFWTRWRREYLLLQQPRQKWNTPHRNMKVGDIVLVMDDGEPRCRWPLGKLTRVHSDNEGFVRSVVVRTRSSELSRPVTKLILIVPVEEQEGSNSPVHQ